MAFRRALYTMLHVELIEEYYAFASKGVDRVMRKRLYSILTQLKHHHQCRVQVHALDLSMSYHIRPGFSAGISGTVPWYPQKRCPRSLLLVQVP